MPQVPPGRHPAGCNAAAAAAEAAGPLDRQPSGCAANVSVVPDHRSLQTAGRYIGWAWWQTRGAGHRTLRRQARSLPCLPEAAAQAAQASSPGIALQQGSIKRLHCLHCRRCTVGVRNRIAATALIAPACSASPSAFGQSTQSCSSSTSRSTSEVQPVSLHMPAQPACLPACPPARVPAK